MEEYLTQEFEKIDSPKIYAPFFKNFANSNALIINFNYTNILDKLYSDLIDPTANIVHLHGQLNDLDNKIIFGYAADYDESNLLQKKNDNEYLKNIKRLRYKDWDNFDRIREYLKENKQKDISIHILGHSCGISDKLILSEILEQEAVQRIYVYYYETVQKFGESVTNIDRIVRDQEILNKVANFKISSRMPQKKDFRKISEIDRFREKMDGIQWDQKNNRDIYHIDVR